MVGLSHLLIDHILINSPEGISHSGTVVLDISDHFMTFVQLPIQANKAKNTVLQSRNFSTVNINKFKQNLQTQTWDSVLACNNVNDSYTSFWDIFKLLFDLNFPVKDKKFNKNLHKLNKFMTSRLLVSRTTKINLHKKMLPTMPPQWKTKINLRLSETCTTSL
jgi:hypothetical protein